MRQQQKQGLLTVLLGGNRPSFWLMRKFGRPVLALIAALLFLLPSAAHAATLISQGYKTSESAPVGSIVSLKKDSTTEVSLASVTNTSSIFGVVIAPDSSQVSVVNGEDNQVQVATSGVQQVLVSDINGNISAGDQITASPINGIGMKATTSTKVVGVAQDKFPNSTASSAEYTDKEKKKHSVKLGQVAVVVNVAYYYKTPDKTIIPASIQNIANALAGKTVNPLPVIISIGIFLITITVVVSIIYALIHSSIISVGRNPMSQSAVYRNVIQLSLLIVIILAVSVLSIYMVLRKF